MRGLSPNYVMEPFQDLLHSCQNTVLLGLRLVENIETFPGPTAEERSFFQFIAPTADLSDSKATFRRWLLLKGLGDIHQCIRAMIEEIHRLENNRRRNKVEPCAGCRRANVNSVVTCVGFITPELIAKANQLCSQPLTLQDKIATFNNARNCLEHTSGTVTRRFCNGPHDRLVILGRRFKLFFKRNEEEILAEFGKPGLGNAALMIGAEDFALEFAIEHNLELSLKHFLDILNTCVFLRAEIEMNLVPSER